MRAMKAQYGSKEGEKVFYASKNKGTITGVDEEVKGTASPAMKALMKRTAELKAKRDRIALMKANKKRKDDETQMNWQNKLYESLVTENTAGKAMRAAISSGEQKTDTQPGRGGPLAKRAKLLKKIGAMKPRQGGQGVPAESLPTFMKYKLDSPGERPASEKNRGTRAARRAVARTAGQPEAERRAAGHSALKRG